MSEVVGHERIRRFEGAIPTTRSAAEQHRTHINSTEYVIHTPAKYENTPARLRSK
jgi:hypothetical protein